MFDKLKSNKKITCMIILLATGVFLVMLPGIMTGKKTLPEVATEPAVDYNMEKQLEEILETVEGVSDVGVFITYENYGKKNVAITAEENISEDDNRRMSSYKSSIVTTRENGVEKPFVSQEVLPQIRGVIVCAKGVSNEEKKLIIADAVSAVTGVSMHRVKVLERD